MSSFIEKSQGKNSSHNVYHVHIEHIIKQCARQAAAFDTQFNLCVVSDVE